MADVMPHGHGGDGAEEPPPHGGFGRGHHEADLVPRKKTRGKARNTLLRQTNKVSGPVSIPFDRSATFSPVGAPSDMFGREVGIYMWANFAFDKIGYNQVSDAQKNAMEEHLRRLFNFKEIEKDLDHNQLNEGIRSVYMKRYNGRKCVAKEMFLQMGGYDNIESIRETPPLGMGVENWKKTLDHFCSDKYRKKCEVNKLNRQKQKVTNRGGTSSHASWAYKKNKSKLETYRDAHTLPDGRFASAYEEETYNSLKGEYDSRRAEATPYLEGENEFEESMVLDPNEVEIFEKVLGTRRGHVRGIGRKPSSSVANFTSPQESDTCRPQIAKEIFEDMMQDPIIMARMNDLIDERAQRNKVNEDEDMGENDGNEDMEL